LSIDKYAISIRDAIPLYVKSQSLIGVFRINQLITGTVPAQSGCCGRGGMMCEVSIVL
jgi:hypothetical protein